MVFGTEGGATDFARHEWLRKRLWARREKFGNLEDYGRSKENSTLTSLDGLVSHFLIFGRLLADMPGCSRRLTGMRHLCKISGKVLYEGSAQDEE